MDKMHIILGVFFCVVLLVQVPAVCKCISVRLCQLQFNLFFFYRDFLDLPLHYTNRIALMMQMCGVRVTHMVHFILQTYCYI